MLGDMVPFRMIGNLYFVGTKKMSSHVIATSEGLIMIDVGYEETADVVMESLQTLGFSLSDVKIILCSHGHGDHTRGVPKMKAATGAKVYLAKEDLKYVSFEPDVYYEDEMVVKLGGTEVKCQFTPGHTEGAYTFYFDVFENGVRYRAAMFGGAGTNQLKKTFMRNHKNVSYLMRGAFLDSLERIEDEPVDVMVGNHTWHNHTCEKYQQMIENPDAPNPFVNPQEWKPFIQNLRRMMWNIIEDESRTDFVVYAHRGASEYCPENTMLSFYTGVFMGANGIETDIHRTSDGVLVLFHDHTLERVTDGEGKISDYTFEELQKLNVEKNGLTDKIVAFEDFLKHFAHRDLTFAIELKQAGVEEDVSDLIMKYGIEKKCVVTSFHLEYLRAIKAYNPLLRVGYLTKELSDPLYADLASFGCDEICPIARDITPELVKKLHRMGFNVRAWGVGNEETMKTVYDAHADGMTVNFPDKLVSYIRSQNPTEEA